MAKKRSKRTQHQLGKLRQAKKGAFLEAFARVGTITHAAEIAGIERDTHYGWLERDPAYALLYEQAEGKAADTLEREARRRAVDGIDEPVIYQGQVSGTYLDMAGRPVPPGDPQAEAFVPLTVKKYSDILLIFLLKGARPEKYREGIDVERPQPLNVQIIQFNVDNRSAQIQTPGIRAALPPSNGLGDKTGGVGVAPASWER